MSVSHFAGVAIIPTLSRIVLCAAFTTAGYGKLLVDSTYSADQARRLRAMGVNLGREDLVASPDSQPHEVGSVNDEPAAPSSTSRSSNKSSSMEPSSTELSSTELSVNEPLSDTRDEQQSAGDSQTPAADSRSDPPASPPQQTAESARQTSLNSVEEPRYVGASVHKLALMLEDANWPLPRWIAIMAGVTELAGGLLIFIGLFSRLWAAAFAVSMGLAFYLTSLATLRENMLLGLDSAEFYQVFTQAGLFTLALGVLLTGPGPLSLDWVLFRRTNHEDHEFDADTDLDAEIPPA